MQQLLVFFTYQIYIHFLGFWYFDMFQRKLAVFLGRSHSGGVVGHVLSTDVPPMVHVKLTHSNSIQFGMQ